MNLLIGVAFVWFVIFKIIPKLLNNNHKNFKNTSNYKTFNPPESNYFSDWNYIRIKAFNKYGKKCSECDCRENLQVHHKLPRSMGGKDNLDNLMILCKKCHEKLHGYEFSDEYDFLYENEFYKSTSTIRNKKVQIIQKAIDNKKNIEIKYQDMYKNITYRKITPIKVYYENRKIYLKSYCHLRKSERTFKISRIQNLKIILL